MARPIASCTSTLAFSFGAILLAAKSWTVDEFGLLGVKRERGKAASAYLADPDTGKYRGSAFITLGRDLKDRPWKRVQEHAGPRPKAMKERPAAEWVKSGVISCTLSISADRERLR